MTNPNPQSINTANYIKASHIIRLVQLVHQLGLRLHSVDAVSRYFKPKLTLYNQSQTLNTH